MRRNFSSKSATTIRTDNEGPIKILHKKVQANELKVDEHQERVMVALQKLYEIVQTYKPEPPQQRGLFSWLTSNKKDQDISKVKAPKGLYIHGSVGGGKTTLMDLFFNCCHSVRNSIITSFRLFYSYFLRFFRLTRRNGFISTHL